MKKTLSLAAFSATVLFALTGCDAITDEIKGELQNADIGNATKLSITGSADSIDIEAVDGADEVKSSGSDKVVVTKDGDEVTVVLAGGDITLETSPDLALSLVLDDGDVKITNYAAGAEIASLGGTVDMQGSLKDDEEVKIAGDVSSVVLDLVLTGSADIDLAATGDIEVDADLQGTADVDIATPGDITVKIPSDAKADLDATGLSVSVSADLTPVPEIPVPLPAYTGTLNGGGDNDINIAGADDSTVEVSAL